LHANKADKAKILVTGEPRSDGFQRDTPVGLIDRGDLDVDIWAEHLPLGRAAGERIDDSKRVRGIVERNHRITYP
jgi:hypothetical protein